MRGEAFLPLCPGWQLLRIPTVPYEEALAWQRRQVERMCAGAMGNTLLLCEHPPVYTRGRGSRDGELLAPDANAPGAVPVVDTDRGGRITYHGPGQLVAYLVRDLRPRLGVRDHVWRLEELVIRTMAHWGVDGQREADNPGVWVGGEKIAALGVRVSGGIAYHGLSLNRDPDLGHYRDIIPCGLAGRGVTSLARLGLTVTREALEARLLAAFPALFAGR